MTLVICTAILSTALMRSDVYHRGETVIDPLTGMLNRKALASRVAELEQQSLVSGEPIGLVVGDLDRFKEVNDSCGHATGDAVLKEVAYAMRKELRAFDLAYRLGGEEFLVVLPGADSDTSALLAERLRDVLAVGQLQRRPPDHDELWRERVAPGPAIRVPDGVRRGRRGALRGQAGRPRPGPLRARPGAGRVRVGRASRDRVRGAAAGLALTAAG